MPVTAKLSRKFYEEFGDEIANELVDWFNAVDLTYRTQLLEINDLNWERFKAALHGEGAAIRGEFRAEMAQFREEIHVDMHGLRSEMLKWMFIYWTGSVVTLGGLMVALRAFA